jgi:rubredoxin
VIQTEQELAILEPWEVLAGYRVIFDDDGTLTVEDGVVEIPSGDATVYRWRCAICGYIHEAPEPPRWCPLCGADASAFAAVAEEG